MFRDMMRRKEALSEAECIDILKKELRGVLCVLGDEDYPYGMPLNHYYCEEDGKIYFHGGMKGHRIDAVRAHDKVSFCVYDQGYRENGDWALHIRSVIVFGRAELVEDREKTLDISRRLCHKFTQDETYIEHEIQNSGPGTLLMCLTPEHMSGKIVKEA